MGAYFDEFPYASVKRNYTGDCVQRARPVRLYSEIDWHKACLLHGSSAFGLTPKEFHAACFLANQLVRSAGTLWVHTYIIGDFDPIVDHLNSTDGYC